MWVMFLATPFPSLNLLKLRRILGTQRSLLDPEGNFVRAGAGLSQQWKNGGFQ
jgi:hypothetical protein